MNTTKIDTLRQKHDQATALRSTIKQVYIYVVLLLIVILFSVMKLDQVKFFERGHFLSPDSVINLMRTAVPILTLSGAFTLLMISGYIDLSVGSAMSLSAVVFALMILNGFSFLPALVITLIVGIAMGALNGYLVMKLRITPVIATLVTLSLYKGAALLIVPDGLSAIKGSTERPMPAWINDYARQDVLPETLWERLCQSPLPRLWVPKRDHLIPIEAIPTLGTGKTDLRRLKQLALTHTEAHVG
jgi:ribose/xylose/arabinose/galactoside ABC-type transport system permease subunit